MSDLTYIIISAILAAIAYRIGWHTGRQHGRDEQWADDFIAQGRRDAARRDIHGRFTSTRLANTPRHTPQAREG